MPPSDGVGDAVDPIASFARAALPAWRARRRLLADGGLAPFLDHVVRTVPRYGGCPADLGSFPVVDRAAVAADVASFRSPEFALDAGMLGAETNGTVRRKLRVAFDLAAWFDVNYGTYDAVLRQVPGLAARTAVGTGSVVLVVDNPAARPAMRVVPTLHDAVLHQVVLGADPERDTRLVRDLAENPPDLLYGRPSTLIELARFARGGTGVRPGAILTSGENLYEDDRARLEDRFGAAVTNAYVATEGGLIGIECPHRTGLHVQHDRGEVELLDDTGAIVREGVGAVLLTAATNWAQGFVRYLVGDDAVVEAVRCPCGHAGSTITRLWGGEVREFRTSRAARPASAIGSAVLGAGVSRFQVRQQGPDHLRVTWVPDGADVAQLVAVQHRLRTALAELAPEVAVEPVPVGHLTARGGKARRFPAGAPVP